MFELPCTGKARKRNGGKGGGEVGCVDGEGMEEKIRRGKLGMNGIGKCGSK